MAAHPVHDLPEENVLGLRVPEQVVQLYLGLGLFNHHLEALVGFLDSVESHALVDVFDLLRVELVMEPLDCVAENWRLARKTQLNVCAAGLR